MKGLHLEVVFATICFAVAKDDYSVIDWSNIKSNNVKVPILGKVKPGADIVPHIVGGSEAARGQLPYQAGLFFDNRYFCGGSLISKSIVLTAAHCTHGRREVTVYLGAHMIKEMESNRVMFTSLDHTSHPLYQSENRRVDFDIAVVRLPKEATLTPYINTVSLPSPQSDYLNFRARVSGWGIITDANKNISNVLNYVDLTVVSNIVCRRSFGLAINPAKLCAATKKGGNSPCHGDSGGPLVIQEADRKYTQIGIVSFGSGRGCSVGAPAVFTRVTSYVNNFIAKFM